MSYNTAGIKILSGLEPQKRYGIQEKRTRGDTPLRSVAWIVLPNSTWERSSNHAQLFAIAVIKKLTIEPVIHIKLCNHLKRKENFRSLVNSNTPLSDLEKQILTTTIKQIHSGLTSRLGYRKELERIVLPLAKKFFSQPEANRIPLGLFVELLKEFVSKNTNLVKYNLILHPSDRLLRDILKDGLPAGSYSNAKPGNSARETIKRFLKSELIEALPN